MWVLVGERKREREERAMREHRSLIKCLQIPTLGMLAFHLSAIKATSELRSKSSIGATFDVDKATRKR